MLVYSGFCLSCRPRDVNYMKDGVQKTFRTHRCCLHDPDSEQDPIYIETGEAALEKGKAYRIAVRVSNYVSKKTGEIKLQFNTYRAHPPKELTPKGSAEAK